MNVYKYVDSWTSSFLHLVMVQFNRHAIHNHRIIPGTKEDLYNSKLTVIFWRGNIFCLLKPFTAGRWKTYLTTILNLELIPMKLLVTIWIIAGFANILHIKMGLISTKYNTTTSFIVWYCWIHTSTKTDYLMLLRNAIVQRYFVVHILLFLLVCVYCAST